MIAAWYWGVGGEYYRRADLGPLNPEGELLAVLQIETPEGVENIEEIITTPGVGALPPRSPVTASLQDHTPVL